MVGGMGSRGRPKPMLFPHVVHPHLKLEPPPFWKTTHPLKREAPFNEMIPRKSNINNNLKLVWDLTKKIKENKEVKVNKNIKKISA